MYINNNNNSKDSVYVEQSSLLAHGCHWLMQVGYDKWVSNSKKVISFAYIDKDVTVYIFFPWFCLSCYLSPNIFYKFFY
jgi:hypothetical protein